VIPEFGRLPVTTGPGESLSVEETLFAFPLAQPGEERAFLWGETFQSVFNPQIAQNYFVMFPHMTHLSGCGLPVAAAL
jgi:hypothetical protein